MNDSTEIGRRFSYFHPYFKRVDEDDYDKGYYVSDIVYQNDGGRWYRGISFDTPESIDTLIFALVYAKEAAKHQKLCSDDDTYTAVRNGDNSCKAVLKDGAYTCEWCGTPHPLDSWERYEQGKPKFCMNCGAFFKEYDELMWAADDVEREIAELQDENALLREQNEVLVNAIEAEGIKYRVDDEGNQHFDYGGANRAWNPPANPSGFGMKLTDEEIEGAVEAVGA